MKKNFVDVKNILVVAKLKDTKGENISETRDFLCKNNLLGDFFTQS